MSLRAKIAKNGNHSDARAVVIDHSGDDMGWSSLFTLAANKLKLKKACRAFVVGGTEIPIGSDLLRRLPQDITIVVSAGEEYSGHINADLAPTVLKQLVPSDGSSPPPPAALVTIVADQTRVDEDAIQQLRKVAEWENVAIAVGLPDLHPGQSHPVGAAVGCVHCIYPALVGNDIGCGMMLMGTDLQPKSKIDKWVSLLEKANLDDGLSSSEAAPFLAEHQVEESYFRTGFGTIGGGNHFAEFQTIEEIHDPEICSQVGLVRDQVYLLVHSGSRGLGDDILDTHLRTYGQRGVTPEEEAGISYLKKHDMAVKWGYANRAAIAHRFLTTLKGSGTHVISNVCHNNVLPTPFHDGRCLWLHRKGAAPSNTGAPVVVIPGSRGAMSYVVAPIAEKAHESGYSLAHGAGREIDRATAAKRGRKYRVEDLTTTALGSQVVCADHMLLAEEAPEAYKDIDSVVGDLVSKGLVKVVCVMRPILTYKTMSTDKGRREGYELRK
eukprot:PhF_6_TR23297/c0_g1_i1/m.32870/K18148/rtcB; release factor H-coupled RctB family protein